ncbi:MAG: OmpH family outer membrane protein [Planctomycetota bacterium]|jgi:Skp family chaperone for outer membrane proteins|nr:OmpH family outer membrane protein [Planctomycetota bacterium]
MSRFFSALTALLAVLSLNAAETSIGIVYVERVFENSTMVQQLQTDLKAKAEQVAAVIDKITKELDDLKDELETLPQSAPAFAEKKEKFEILRLRRKLFLERSQKALQGEEAARLKASYMSMREHLSTYAKSKGLGLVMMAPLPEIRAQRIQELNLELATHTVLYHEPQFDITADFTSFLNAQTPAIEGEIKPKDEPASSPEIDLGDKE